MFEYSLCSHPRGRDPSPQRRPPSSSPVVSSLSVESRCSAAYSEPAAALPQRWPRTRCRTCPPRPRRCIPPGASRRAHGRQHCPTASDAAADCGAPPPAAHLPCLAARAGPSAGRPGRVSSYTSTGASRVVSVASPFTTYSVECTDMPVSRAARPVDLREAGAKDRRPVLPQGAAHNAGVRRPLSIRHWSGRVRSFCAPRRIALKGCYWCSDAGVSIWRPVAGGIPCPPPATFRRRVIIDVSMPAFRSDVRFQRSQIESV